MKEILSIVVIVFVLFGAMPAFSYCAKDEKDVVTGAACSVSELNSPDRSDNFRGDSKIGVIKERDLRPLKIHKEFSTTEKTGCYWGECLTKQILSY